MEDINHSIMMLSLRGVFLLLLLSTVLALIGKKDWSKVDWEQAGKALENGDDSDLLIEDDKLAMDDYDRRRSKGMQKPDDDIALKCVQRIYV